MGELFLKVLNMSITASWLILAVIVIRAVFSKMPKWMTCLLWGSAAVRLICPYSVKSVLSILPSTELVKNTAVVQGKIMEHIPSIDSEMRIVQNSINPKLEEIFAYPVYNSAAPWQVFVYVLGIVWICGMTAVLMYALISRIRVQKLVSEAVKENENVYLCDHVKSPFVLGMIKPRIYLPSNLDRSREAYILAHENAHIKRKDHWWKPLGFLILSVHWFNPFCWIAYTLFCRDIETACDEKVIEKMTFEEKKEYAKTLLSCGQQKRLILSCPVAFGEGRVKERVSAVLKHKRPSFWILMLASVFIVLLALLFLTDPMGQEDSAKGANEVHIIETYEKTPIEMIDTYFDNSLEYIQETYYKMSDGTWMTGGYYYKYRLEIFGRMNNAAKDTTYIILSNRENITFEEAWKASGLSSHMDDYFEKEDARIVGFIVGSEEEPV